MDRAIFKKILIAFLLVLVTGTFGYWFIEGWSLLDSFFMTVITITTVGYKEVGGELSAVGKIFTIFLIFSGFGVAALALSHFSSVILRGELNNLLGRIRMRKEIENMTGHYIIGGFGRTGQVIAESFHIKKIPFLVIDNEEKSLRRLQDLPFPFIVGDAGDEETLKKAGIEKAKGFVAVVSSDAANAFAIMTARVLNSKLNIIARALDSQSIRKLKIAGANKVIAPYLLGGSRIAQAVVHPHASDFIDVVEDVGAAHIELAELLVVPTSPLCGKSVGDSILSKFDVLVVGIRRESGEFVFHPKGPQKLEARDNLILMGSAKNIEKLYHLIQVS